MNALSGTHVLAENRLFATLDATTRLVHLAPNKPALLSDTVGFIRKLPHQLVESFKSTLDEVREADLLLHVVDASHQHFEDHMGVVRETLRELGALEKPTLVVFNKVDAVADRTALAAVRQEYAPAVMVSALRGIGLDDLRRQLLTLVEADYVEREALLPLTEAKSRAHVHSVAEVLGEDLVQAEGYDPEPIPAVRLRYRASARNAPDLERMLARFAHLRALPGPPGGDGAVPTAAIEGRK